MAPSDVDQLVDMGFDKERSELAVRQGGGLQGAIDWLDKNQDKSLEDIKAAIKEDEAENGPALQPGEQARSLICNECGKRFRSTAQAEFHASKTEHADFSESTEELAPLTEEEKATKLAELRERAAERKRAVADEDRAALKRNEQIRLKSTKEQQDAKERLARDQQIKEAQEKRREQRAELDAKKRIQAKIAQDKEDRRLRAERDKAARAGQPLPPAPAADPAPTPAPASAESKPTAAYTTARLRLQTSAGVMQQTLPAETTLFELAHKLQEEKSELGEISTFQSNFPRKVFERSDFGMTLKEAGLVPSAALIVR